MRTDPIGTGRLIFSLDAEQNHPALSRRITRLVGLNTTASWFVAYRFGKTIGIEPEDFPIRRLVNLCEKCPDLLQEMKVAHENEIPF